MMARARVIQEASPSTRSARGLDGFPSKRDPGSPERRGRGSVRPSKTTTGPTRLDFIDSKEAYEQNSIRGFQNSKFRPHLAISYRMMKCAKESITIDGALLAQQS
jgi:hypothetical protein